MTEQLRRLDGWAVASQDRWARRLGVYSLAPVVIAMAVIIAWVITWA
jgi:hypothetical protein